ncbi:MAG: sigma-70 family RNA polymerase sigma factor, partial [Planctomycetota bacterium]|nr:sigma-70 family RNA polymerase sigma factor [Planctomycetota bacterium]
MNWINVEENILLKRAIYRQDRSALEILHARHYQSILRYIAARVDSGADAEDLAQDVFVELCKGNGYYDGRRNTQEYLFGIARNTIRRYLRSRRNSIGTISIDSIADVGSGYDIQQHRDPVKQVSEQDIRKTIEDMIAQLPPKAHEAIKLR